MRIGIVGLGLIGGSLAGALSAAGHSITGFDIDPASLRVATEQKLIERPAPVEVLARESDVVILCVPLEATVQAVYQLAPLMAENAILTDVASLKRPVITAMDSVSSRCRRVGGHPIAGREISGIGAVDIGLFRDASYAIVPARYSGQEAVDVMKGLAVDVGAHPIEVDGETHDRLVARTSHLPQALSSALSVYLDSQEGVDFQGPGAKGMLRLAKSDEELWTEILMHNAGNVSTAIKEFVDVLHRLEAFIETRDKHGIKSFMRSARESVT